MYNSNNITIVDNILENNLVSCYGFNFYFPRTVRAQTRLANGPCQTVKR